MSDEDLYKKCCQIGGNAIFWARSFEGIIPEIEKRKLYEKYGFGSIIEFSAKIAGMKKETVLEVLRVARKLEDIPKLKELLENGSVGWSKLRVIANIATTETEDFWAKKIIDLPKNGLEALAREFV